MACLSSVLKVPDAGSNTSSDEKFGPIAAWFAGAGAPFWVLGASGFPWNVRAGRFKVKLSTSLSKSNAGLAPAVGLGLVGVGRGR